MTTTFTLLGVSGERIGLAGPKFWAGREPSVFGLAPVESGVQAAPALSAGSRRGSTRFTDRPVTMPIIILADTQQDLWESTEYLAQAVDPTRGDCLIIAERPDGERREIVVQYSAGLVPTVAGAWSRETSFPLTFRAPHPFWRATTPNSVRINFPVTGTGLNATPFSSDLIPFSDAATPFNGWESSSTQGTVVTPLNNSGTAPSWPLWRFTGPLTGVSATNLTTGRSWSWTRAPWSTLNSGSTLEVRTVEQSDAVRLTSGDNKYRGLSTARDLWPLAPGDNLVLLEVTGASTETTASVSYHPEYLTC